MKKEHQVSAQQRANKTALVSYGVMNFILIACYLLEVVKKSRTIGYFAVFCVLAIVPWLVSGLIYKKNRASELIQYTIPIGFCIFYLFIIFTTISPVAYVYAFIIAVVLILLWISGILTIPVMIFESAAISLMTVLSDWVEPVMASLVH